MGEEIAAGINEPADYGTERRWHGSETYIRVGSETIFRLKRANTRLPTAILPDEIVRVARNRRRRRRSKSLVLSCNIRTRARKQGRDLK